MKSDWLFCGLVRGFPPWLSPDPLCVGAFELTRRLESMAEHEARLKESAAAFSLALGDHLVRVRCFLRECTAEDARRDGVIYAREMVDMLPLLFPLHRFTLLPAGFVADLRGPRSESLLPTARDRMIVAWVAPGPLDEVAQEPALTVNGLLSSGPTAWGDLGAALRKSTHWQSLARSAAESSEELLLLWMAAEVLARVQRDEVLAPKFLAALGVPVGRLALQLPRGVSKRSAQDPAISAWKRRLGKLLPAVERVRNKVVHEGFRDIELGNMIDSSDQRAARRAMRLLVDRLHRMALTGLRVGERTVKGMWTRYGAIWLEVVGGSPDNAELAARGLVQNLEMDEEFL
jgi:hypothetical protein